MTWKHLPMRTVNSEIKTDSVQQEEQEENSNSITQIPITTGLQKTKILSPRLMNPSSSSTMNNSNHSALDAHNEMNHGTQLLFSSPQRQQHHRMARQQKLVHDEEEYEEEEEENDDNMEVDMDAEEEFDEEESPTTSAQLHHNDNELDGLNKTWSSSSSQPPTPLPTLVRQSRNNNVRIKQENHQQNNSVVIKKEEDDVSFTMPSPSPVASNSNHPITPTVTPRSRNTTNAKGTSWLATQPKLNAKSKSGYILFSAEVRKRVMNENPDAGFGEVSKIVGIEWKKLSDEQKREYETRAQYIADERAKAELLTSNSKLPQPGQIRVHCCRWQQCDYQFDCQDGLYQHVRTHTSQQESNEHNNMYVCLWNSCLKYRKEGKPFPTLPRLLRHVKEKHLPSSIRLMFPNQRAKNYFIYVLPQDLQSSNGGSASKKKQEDQGRFIHQPYGDTVPNAMPCAIATPFPIPSGTPLSQILSAAGISQSGSGKGKAQSSSAISSALTQNLHSSSSSGQGQHRYAPSSTTPTSKTVYGSALLNGTIQNTSSSANTHHYVIQQHPPKQQQHYHHQSQSGQTVQQQTVVIPAGQQAIVVNGTTVYIPANAQTIILPPGYTGPQQQHQIVLHTQPQQQYAPVPPPNGPSSAASVPSHSSSSQQSHLITAASSAHQAHQQHIHAQQSHISSAHPQQTLVNGLPASVEVASPVAAHYASASSSNVQASSSSYATSVIPQGTSQAGQFPHQQHYAATTTATMQPPPTPTSASTLHQPPTPSAPQMQQTAYVDPGRTVVSAPPKSLEPMFVAPSSSLSVRRVVHSETYIKYLESMYKNNSAGKSQNVSKWDRALQASQRNTTVPNHKKLPYEWIQKSANGSKSKEDEIVRALWKLRNQLVEGTNGILMEKGAEAEATAPRPSGFEDGPSSSANGDRRKAA